MSVCDSGEAMQHENLLVYSNLVYLTPAAVVIYRTVKDTLPVTAAIELVPFYLFVTFFSSWSYHACRGNLARDGVVDLCENNSNSQEYGVCNTCPKTGLMFTEMQYNQAIILDHILAFYAILLSVIHVLPLRSELAMIARTIGLIWIIGSLMVSSSNGDDIAIVIFIPLILLLLVFFAQTYKTFKSRAICWPIGLGFAISSFVCFFQNHNYWLNHSLWHIFSGVAASFFLAGGVDYQHETMPKNKLTKNIWKTLHTT